MVPLHLSIQGLYSYQDQQQVDFTRLTEAGLFGIFGAVGSGKTTILEAMSLCIYGRTERFNQRGDDRYYNMLNLKESEAHVSFTFLAGNDARRFRAEVRLRRNRNKYEEVGLVSHSFYELDGGGEPMPVDQKIVLAAVGISYENFKRTLVIPQGQFREFLELPPRERTEMMKELFGLHRFDRAARVSELAAENKNLLTAIEGSLKLLAEATEDEWKELESKATGLTQQVGQWTKWRDERHAALQVLDNLQTLSNSLRETREQLEGLLRDGQGDASMLDRISRYEQLRDRYSVLLRDIDALAADIRENQQAHDRLLTERESRVAELAVATTSLDQAEKSRQESEALQPRADELGKMAEIHSMDLDIRNLRGKIQAEQARVESGRKKIQDEHKSIQQKETEAESRQAVILPEERCFALRTFYKEQERLQGVLTHDEQRRNTRRENLDVQRQQLTTLRDKTPDSLGSLLPETLTERIVDEASASAIGELNRSKESVRGELTRLAVQKGLRQYAEGLVEGEPCILCGAIHHPNPLQSAHPDEEEKALQHALHELDAAERGLRAHAEQIKAQLRAIVQAERELDEAETASRASVQALANHRQGLQDIQFGPDDWQAFKTADVASNLAKEDIRRAQEAVLKHRQNIAQWTDVLDGLTKGLQEDMLKLAGLEGMYKVAKAAIVQLDLQAYLGMDVQDIQAERDGIVASIQQARQGHDKALERKNRLEREVAEFGARISQSSEFLDGKRIAEARHRTELDTRLQSDGLSSAEVEEVLDWNPDIQGLRQAIDERRQRTDRVRGQLQVFEQQMAGRSYDAVLHSKSREDFAEADAQVRSLTEARGAAEEAIRVMKANLETRRELEEQRTTLTIRSRDIATLQDMFRGNGFVQFVSQRYLENVVAIANRRFRRMVRDKFSIELSEGGEFLVRDYLNGGRTRLLKSLSGGQTFQAALCLALALSENIQHMAGAEQHFFFMDEGFGSLDSENLETVFATLRSLQQERKAVGVISHVAELQQGMDIYLKIEQDPEQGTRVQRSWEM
jgi:exonuclease SbcC